MVSCLNMILVADLILGRIITIILGIAFAIEALALTADGIQADIVLDRAHPLFHQSSRDQTSCALLQQLFLRSRLACRGVVQTDKWRLR